MKRRLLTALLSFLLVASFAFTKAALADPAQDLAAAIEAHPKVPQLASGQKMAPLVSFQSGERMLAGYIYVPAGQGPFPALIWNHGSEQLSGWQPELAAFYNRQGFVFFIPHRTGHGKSPGPYIGDRTDQLRKSLGRSSAALDEAVVKLHEEYNADVVAAVDWLKTQPYVDAGRIVMSGVSYGGIQTVLAAEKGLGISAFIPFAPAAISWENTALRQRLVTAVQTAKTPMFLIQAENDYDTGPSKLLGPIIEAKAAPNRAKIYPAFGTTYAQGHASFASWDIGTAIWGPDVMAFIRAAWEATPR